MVEHLDRCPDCYELFSESARFLQEDAQHDRAGGRVLRTDRRFAVRRVTWAVASVAAVLLVLVLLPLIGSLRSAPAGGKVLLATSDLVGEMSHVDTAARAVEPANTAPLGFASRLTEDQRAFRTGVRLLDLRVAAEAEDRQAAGDALDGLEGLLPGTKVWGPVSGLLNSARAAAESGDFGSLRRRTDELEGALGARLSRQELALGKWTEAGLLAASTGDWTPFGRSEYLEFPESLNLADLGPSPSEARDALAKFRALTSVGSVPAGDLPKLREIFEAVKRSY